MIAFRFLILLVAFCISQISYGQRAELKQLCKGVAGVFSEAKPFHLEYLLTVEGNEQEPGKESMIMHMYKNGTDAKMVMGQVQEVIQHGEVLVMVNHLQKLIAVQIDTGKHMEEQLLLSDLELFADSASSIVLKKEAGTSSYTLRYGPDYIYTLLELRFSDKTRKLEMMYAEFNKYHPDSYKSIRVDYKKWDMNWKPDLNFPDLQKFVTSQGNSRYKPTAAWKQYQFYQPENGVLEIKQ